MSWNWTEDVEDQRTEASVRSTKTPRSYRSIGAGGAAHQISAPASQPRSFLYLSLTLSTRPDPTRVSNPLRFKNSDRKLTERYQIIKYMNQSWKLLFHSFQFFFFSLSSFFGCVLQKLNCNGRRYSRGKEKKKRAFEFLKKGGVVRARGGVFGT